MLSASSRNRFPHIVFLVALGLAFSLIDLPSAFAAPTSPQRKLARQCEQALQLTNKYIDARDLKKAADLVKKIQLAVARLSSEADPDDREMRRILTPLKRRLAEVHGVLELEGVTLPPLDAPAKSAKPAAPDDPPSATKVSFQRQVAPILVSRCAGCHGGSKPKGELSMDTFAKLEHGEGGSAIFDPGQSKVSRMIEVIVAGDMPKGGGKVSRAELAMLTRWIDEGAKFDGKDRDMPLKQMVAATGGNSPPRPAAGTVAFSTHVAPLLAQHCVGCHGGQQPRSGLNVGTFQNLMRGGNAGRAITAGNSAGSLLVQKLKGTAPDGQRMPLNAAPLPAKAIADIEKWIAAGAEFDGPDAAAPVAEVAALAVAQNSTHEQLSRRRAEQADKNWQLALSDVEPLALPTDNFLVYGSVGREKLSEIARLAEQQQSLLRSQLGLPADGPLIKGGLTLFVMGLRVDYSEFAFMVEKRKVERTSRGHWRYSIVDAYGCLVPAKNNEYDLPPLLAQQIAGATVAARSGAPRWFSEGVGRAMAAKLGAEDPRIVAWDNQIPALAQQVEKPDDFMTGELPQEDADLLSYGFVAQLMSNQRQFKSLMAALWKGEALDAAMTRVYRRPPAELAALWLRSAAKGKPKRRQ